MNHRHADFQSLVRNWPPQATTDDRNDFNHLKCRSYCRQPSRVVSVCGEVCHECAPRRAGHVPERDARIGVDPGSHTSFALILER